MFVTAGSTVMRGEKPLGTPTSAGTDKIEPERPELKQTSIWRNSECMQQLDILAGVASFSAE